MAPRLSVSQISTLNSSFADDIRTYRAAGFDGIGVWELKLPVDGRRRGAARPPGGERARVGSGGSGRSVDPALAAPGRPRGSGRADRRLLPLARAAGGVPADGARLPDRHRRRPRPDAARSLVVEGLRTIAAVAEQAGVRVGIEPYQRVGGDDWTIVSSIPDAVELIHEAGDSSGARDPVRRLAPMEHRDAL